MPRAACRRFAVRAAPNAAHRALVDLERAFDVRIVTQNVDDLHERAGSTHVLHLHGEISGSSFEVIAKPATIGVPEVVADLLAGAISSDGSSWAFS